MTRVRHCLPIITAACLTSIGPVQAGDSAGVLREVQGNVLVNQGTNYVVGYSGMELKLGARALTLDGASAAVKRPDGCLTSKRPDGCLTSLEPNSRFILREPGVATMERVGPSDDDAPAVASGATSDKGPSIMGTIEVVTRTGGPPGVDDRPPPISAFR